VAKVILQIATLKNLLRLLHKRELSKRQLAELTGIQHVTICRWIETLHNGPENLVYISRWARSHTVGPYTAFYSYGYCMEDVPKPSPITKEEKNRRLRMKTLTQLTDKGLIHVSQ